MSDHIPDAPWIGDPHGYDRARHRRLCPSSKPDDPDEAEAWQRHLDASEGDSLKEEEL